MSENLQGFDEFKRKLENLKNIDKGKVGVAGCYKLEALADSRVPVKTGFLRNSPHVDEIPDSGATLTYSTNYAYYIEYGSSRNKAHPFIRPTIDTDGEEILKAMGDEVERQQEEGLK